METVAAATIDPSTNTAAARRAQRVAALCRYIESCDTPPPLALLAQRAGLSPGQVQRLFKATLGLTPCAWAQGLRARRVRDALAQGAPVTQAAFDAGWNAGSRFWAQAGSVLGMAPSRYRAGGAGEAVRFAVGQCALGAILVACSARGVCAISLGDDPEPLVRELQDRFPAAQLHGDDPAFDALVAQVVALVERPACVPAPELPLDIRGTAFQQRVWQALRQVPPGARLSYAQLAARLGVPAAVRAVAGACAANTLAVAIPCHRVVRSDGALSGYRWGVARKHELLAREAQAARDAANG